MRKRYLAAAAVIVAIVVAVLWRTAPWAPKAASDQVYASGTVDATEVAIAFRAPGVLRERPVNEGSVVKTGDMLAALDAREASARLRQAHAAEDAARARMIDMEQGYRPQEIAEARAQVEQMRANLVNLEDEARRSQALFDGGAVTRQRRDKDRTAAVVALEQHRAAGERLKLLQSGYRREAVNAARAQTKEAQAVVESARVAVEDLKVRSPIDGVVTRKHAEPGETLAAGRPVVTVTDLSKPWVRVYISEREIGRVRLGAPAKITVDTFPGREFEGRVTYVASQAEFTPKNVQTQEERVKLVFAVNVTSDSVDGVLKPGMPADVAIAAATSPVESQR